MQENSPATSGIPFLALIIPAYNEERRIKSTLEKVTSYLQAQNYSWEVIVVDDGSTDMTASVVSNFARTHSGLSLLSIPHKGKGSAVRAGMLHTKGQYRFMCDADLSMPIEQLERFLPAKIGDYDIALGSREISGAHRFQEPPYRHLMGRLFNAFVRVMAVPGFMDTQCGFKCFAGDTANQLFSLQRINGFAFDVEIMYLASRKGLKIKEVPIDWYYEKESKVRPIRDSLLMVANIVRIHLGSFVGKYRQRGR